MISTWFQHDFNMNYVFFLKIIIIHNIYFHFPFCLGGRGLSRQPSQSRQVFEQKMQNLCFQKKYFFEFGCLCFWMEDFTFCANQSCQDPTQNRTKWRPKIRKKSEKKFPKKIQKIFLRFFFSLCALATTWPYRKKWNWENEKPVFFGAPLGRTRSLFRLRAAPLGEKARSCCRWHSLAGALCRRRFVFLFFLFPLFFSLSSLLFFFPLFFFSFLPFLFPFLLFLSFPSLLFLFSSSPPSFSLFFSLSFPAVSLPSCLVQGLGLRVWGCML